MRVFLTGATGHVGSFTVRALLEAGHEVRALVRDPARLSIVGLEEGGGLETVVGDVTDAASVRDAMVGCDAGVHTAAAVAIRRRDGDAARTVNVEGTRTVLDAAAEAGLDPLVYTSSVAATFPVPGPVMTADDPPANPTQSYSASKADAHRLALAHQEAGEPVVILTLGGVFGPGPGTAPATENLHAFVSVTQVGMPITKAGGIPLIDVRDVAAAITACLQPGQGPRRFILGGHFTPPRQLVDLLTASTGGKVFSYRAPAGAIVATGVVCDGIMKVLPVALPMTKEGMQLLTQQVPSDDSATLEALGLTLHPVEESMDASVQWLVEQGHLPEKRAPRFARD